MALQHHIVNNTTSITVLQLQLPIFVDLISTQYLCLSRLMKNLSTVALMFSHSKSRADNRTVVLTVTDFSANVSMKVVYRL